MSDGPMKVGKLAKQTGVSIRTLHHYDEIGLLKPSHRTEAGHRLYTPGDIARLQQIKSLQHLGFSLGVGQALVACRSDLSSNAARGKPLPYLSEPVVQSRRGKISLLPQACGAGFTCPERN